MGEREIPDYSDYTVEQLELALNTVSATRLPEREIAIRAELDRRKTNGTSDIDVSARENSFWKRFWKQVSSTMLVTWFLILSGLWTLGGSVSDFLFNDIPMFDLGGSILLLLASVSLAAGVMLRRQIFVGNFIALIILLLQTISISSSSLFWTCSLLGGVYLRYGSVGDYSKTGIGVDFFEVYFHFASAGPPDQLVLNMNLLTAVFVYVVARNLLTKRADS